MTITITHLYPQHMSLYGDRGNILALLYWASQLNLKINVQNCSLNEPIDQNTKLIMLGGGQDHDQEKVLKDLLNRRNELNDLILGGAIFLGICGGYQLLGEYYEVADGKRLDGLNLLGLYTKKAGIGEKRIIGNVKAKSNLFGLLTGFENHGGRTFLGRKLKPLAQIVQGGGNNAQDQTEGVLQNYGQGLIIGTYFHGFLPKNRQVAQFILKKIAQAETENFENILENINQKICNYLPY